MISKEVKAKAKTLVKEWGSTVAIIAVTLSFRASVYDMNHIPSESMLPTLEIGDLVAVDKAAYDLKLPGTSVVLSKNSDPQRGDIITFELDDGKLLIKRIVALPGDVIRVSNDNVVINEVPTDIKFIDSNDLNSIYEQTLGNKKNHIQINNSGTTIYSYMNPIRVPENSYFVMGDNRRNSLDSRGLGFIEREQINGKATKILTNFDQFLLGLFPASLPNIERSNINI